jgi:6-phosphofructokinase
MKTIGIVTGGGDAPGLNAVIRAAVKTAVNEFDMNVVGIEDSFEGLIGATKVRPLNPSDVRGLLPRGGTIRHAQPRELRRPTGGRLARQARLRLRRGFGESLAPADRRARRRRR